MQGRSLRAVAMLRRGRSADLINTSWLVPFHIKDASGNLIRPISIPTVWCKIVGRATAASPRVQIVVSCLPLPCCIAVFMDIEANHCLVRRLLTPPPTYDHTGHSTGRPSQQSVMCSLQ